MNYPLKTLIHTKILITNTFSNSISNLLSNKKPKRITPIEQQSNTLKLSIQIFNKN